MSSGMWGMKVVKAGRSVTGCSSQWRGCAPTAWRILKPGVGVGGQCYPNGCQVCLGVTIKPLGFARDHLQGIGDTPCYRIAGDRQLKSPSALHKAHVWLVVHALLAGLAS